MAEVAQQTQHEFWRPPMQSAPETIVHTEMIEACDRCASEFIVGSRYCHVCGASRPGANSANRNWSGIVMEQFAGVAEALQISVAALVAFLAGIACLIGALGVGFVFSARTVLDWQAVQLWRIEWLLGAIAMFAAGVLLKRRRA